MSYDARKPKNGLNSSEVQSNFQALDILQYSGFGEYNSTTGTEIKFAEEGFSDLDTSNYSIFITTVIEKGDTMPVIGKVWVDNINPSGFKVYCESNVGGAFSWVLGGKK